MTLIDTSGNYGNGRSEQFISHVIAGQRKRIFLVSKVEPNKCLEMASRVLARRAWLVSARPSRSLFAAFAGAQHALLRRGGGI